MHISKSKGVYSEKEWIEIVENHSCVISIHEFENDPEIKSYGYAIIKKNKKIFGRYLWDWEKGIIKIEMNVKYLSEIYQVFEDIAKKYEGIFYYKSKEIFEPSKHLPIPKIKINRDTKYFESHDLDYIRWLAFREEDRTIILKTLKLEASKEVYLKDGVDENKIILTSPYAGWTFLIGDDLPNLLIKGNESSSEEALTNLCKSLQKLSKQFIEVQYFEYQGESSISGYFKANNGKLVFGHWSSETEEFTKGRIPKDIKKSHPTSAHEIASIWSIDPLDFIYLKEMALQKAIMAIIE